MAKPQQQPSIQTAYPVPLLYRLFFLTIEPLATLSGAIYAYYYPTTYLHLTLPTTLSLALPATQRETIVLAQLANLYLVFALNEALVLRATSDRRVWAVFLLGLLIADFGHVWSVRSLGWEVYWRFWEWNAMYWGNLGFVYVGASMRMAFLAGVGLGGGQRVKRS